MEEELKQLKKFKTTLKKLDKTLENKFEHLYDELMEGYVRDTIDETQLRIEALEYELKEAYLME